MQLTPPPGLVLPAPALGGTRRTLIALALLVPLIFYFGTARSIVTVWNSSETFAHGYLVPVICLWLAWRQRFELRTLPLAPWWPALALSAAAGMLWLLATLAEVQVLRQYALAAMLPLAVLAMCGRRFAAALAFPLLFLLFAVPFGEVFVAPLIDFTADFTVGALRLTGIPVLRNGTSFEIPSGSWSVVEACSGVRYLISSITLGCLYANLSYRSWRRRVLFVALSVVVPIIANGLRAYLIVMIGHLSSMRLAVGVDHIVYGWIFFGLVMFLMFWIGRLWHEEDQPAVAPAPVQARRLATPGAFARMAAALVALAALWPALALLNDRATAQATPAHIATPSLAWPATLDFTSWQPDYEAPDAGMAGCYRAAADAPPVRLALLYYRNRQGGGTLISSVNRLANEHNQFHETGSANRLESMGGRTLALRETTLAGPGGDVLAWHWVRVDGHAVTNDYVGKLWQARARLLLRPGDGSAVIVATPLGENKEAARAALRAFIKANLAPIEATLERTEAR